MLWGWRGFMGYEDLIKWTYKHTKLHEHFVKNKHQITSWKINCGQIYTCYLDENIANEKSKIEARPCVSIVGNRINIFTEKNASWMITPEE